MTLPQLEERINFWQHVLEIKHVRVDVEIQESNDSEAYATCYPSEHFDQAKIVFRTNLFKQDAIRSVDEVIVHELLHFIFRDFDKAARSVGDELGRAAEDIYHERLIHEEERVVDKLANLIVSLVKA